MGALSTREHPNRPWDSSKKATIEANYLPFHVAGTVEEFHHVGAASESRRSPPVAAAAAARVMMTGGATKGRAAAAGRGAAGRRRRRGGREAAEVDRSGLPHPRDSLRGARRRRRPALSPSDGSLIGIHPFFLMAAAVPAGLCEIGHFFMGRSR